MLAERAARGEPLDQSRKALHALLDQDPDPVRKLRALWSLYVIGGADDRFLRGLLDHEHESVRAWAIRRLTDDMPLDRIFRRGIGPDVDPPADLLAKLTATARDDPSGLVRLVLASTLPRLPVPRRATQARALLAHAEDASDHNLPALIWTGLIPVAGVDLDSLASLACECRIPEVIALIARRLGEDMESRPVPLNTLLAGAANRPEPVPAQVVAGLSAALTGWRKARKPTAWDGFQRGIGAAADSGLRARIRDLDVLFGDGRALDEVRRLALDEKAGLDVPRGAGERDFSPSLSPVYDSFTGIDTQPSGAP